MARTIGDYAELVAQWHPTKNGVRLPTDVIACSTDRIWWKCYAAEDHEWETFARSRVSGLARAKTEQRNTTGCPFCVKNKRVCGSTSLMKLRPELAAEWHHIKNDDVSSNDVTMYSGKLVWWLCSGCSHEWQARVDGRAEGRGCPKCAVSVVCRELGAKISNHITSYKSQAKKRGLVWKLHDMYAAELVGRPCHYCGFSKKPYNGIDRVNNTQGYTTENCVPCCSTCNHAKGALSMNDFMEWIQRLTAYQIGQSNINNDLS
jgi:hypothetical protein